MRSQYLTISEQKREIHTMLETSSRLGEFSTSIMTNAKRNAAFIAPLSSTMRTMGAVTLRELSPVGARVAFSRWWLIFHILNASNAGVDVRVGVQSGGRHRRTGGKGIRYQAQNKAYFENVYLSEDFFIWAVGICPQGVRAARLRTQARLARALRHIRDSLPDKFQVSSTRQAE